MNVRARYEQALAEVEEIKRELRERAQRVAAREHELEQLRLEVAGRQGRRHTRTASRERQDELEQALSAAEQREREAAQELALARAERERLDERERTIRAVERELAGQRVALEQERARHAGSVPAEPDPEREPEAEPPPPTPLPQPPPEPELEPAATAGRQPRRRG